MDGMAFENLEVAPPEVVMQAAHDFAAALAETPQFKAFEQAAYRLQHNPAVAQAQAAFLAKQASLKSLLKHDAVPEEDQAELERLRLNYLALPCIAAYQDAEAELRELCQELAGQLTRQIGLDFASASSSGCC